MNSLEFSYPFVLNARMSRLAVSLRIEYLEPTKGARHELVEIEEMEHLGRSVLKKLEAALVEAFGQALEEWDKSRREITDPIHEWLKSRGQK